MSLIPPKPPPHKVPPPLSPLTHTFKRTIFKPHYATRFWTSLVKGTAVWGTMGKVRTLTSGALGSFSDGVNGCKGAGGRTAHGPVTKHFGLNSGPVIYCLTALPLNTPSHSFPSFLLGPLASGSPWRPKGPPSPGVAHGDRFQRR